ncbi:negative cofactor 2 transcription regulator complex subunit ncb2 [Gurleya vavrai]
MDDSLEKINDDEVSLPKATVDKIIIESLSGKLASKEVKETVMRCAVEYIHLITSEANETCERESRKTITHEHIFKALNSLGYGSYIKECEEVLVEHTTLSKMKPSKNQGCRIIILGFKKKLIKKQKKKQKKN